MPLFLIGSLAGTIVGSLALLIGLLSIAYNRRAAEEYARTWGRALKNGYAIGQTISIVGGMLLLLVGLFCIFVRRS